MAEFKNIGIAGIGLIGGSLALEVKKRKIAEKVVGFSRRHSTLEKAKSQGLIDEYFIDFEEGVKNLNLLVIATPVGAVKDYFLKIQKAHPHLLVTDVSSIKEKIVNDALAILGRDSNFVGSHPIAGSDKSGIESVQENLFQGKFAIITPREYTKEENISRIKEFWVALGSEVVLLSPEEHDRLLALTSHFPHFLIFTLILLLEKAEDKEKLLSCIGTGFLDTTRIGKSLPEMWAEIFIANRENLLNILSEFEDNLSEMVRIVRDGNVKELTEKLTGIKKTREELNGKKKHISRA